MAPAGTSFFLDSMGEPKSNYGDSAGDEKLLTSLRLLLKTRQDPMFRMTSRRLNSSQEVRTDLT